MALNDYALSARRNRRNAFYDEEFRDEIIRVDGNVYDGCTFYNCKLEFAATSLATFRRCHFSDSDWFFVDAAANMITFLSQLAHDFGAPGKELLANLFAQLQQSRIIMTDPPTLIAEARGVAHLTLPALQGAGVGKTQTHADVTTTKDQHGMTQDQDR